MAGLHRGEVACLLFLVHRVRFHCSILRQTFKISKTKVLDKHSVIPLKAVNQRSPSQMFWAKDHTVTCQCLLQ